MIVLDTKRQGEEVVTEVPTDAPGPAAEEPEKVNSTEVANDIPF